MHPTTKNILKFVAFLGFGIFLLYMVYSYLESGYSSYCVEEGIPAEECNLAQQVYKDFVGANFLWVFVALIFYMISNLSRAEQWSLLLEPAAHKPKFYNSFWGVMLGYFANLGLPRIGEFIRAGTMSRYESIPYEKVIATVINSRILDLVFLGITTLIALALEYQQIAEFFNYVGESYGYSSLYILGLVAIVGLLVFIYIVNSPLAKNKLIQKIQIVAISFKDGLLSILNVEYPWKLIGHTAVIWIMYVLMTYIGFWAYEPTSDISFSAGLVVFVIGSLGFVLPSSGGMGTYHALIIIGLSFYGISKFEAFSYAMIMFITLQIGANILFGLLSLILLPKLNQSTSKR